MNLVSIKCWFHYQTYSGCVDDFISFVKLNTKRAGTKGNRLWENSSTANITVQLLLPFIPLCENTMPSVILPFWMFRTRYLIKFPFVQQRLPYEIGTIFVCGNLFFIFLFEFSQFYLSCLLLTRTVSKKSLKLCPPGGGSLCSSTLWWQSARHLFYSVAVKWVEIVEMYLRINKVIY